MTRIENTRRALVIDDDPTAALFVKAAAAPLGIGVEFAAGANAAVDMLRARRYDLVLLDHDVDGVRGWELIDYVMPSAGVQRPPILVDSGRVTDDDVAAYRKRQVAEVVPKGGSTEALAFAIRRVLRL